jgi:hypothetical protein
MPSQSRLSRKGRFRPLPLFRHDRFGSVTEPSLDSRGGVEGGWTHRDS